METQWEAKMGEALQIPEAVKERMRYRFTVLFPGDKRPLTGWCADWSAELHAAILYLHDALVDTSDRFEGTVLTGRMTFHKRMTLWGAAGILLPFGKHPDSELSGDVEDLGP